MPPRTTPPPRAFGAYHPSNDAATHRDLLLFEERLKTNAAILNSRKSRYQCFLLQLLLIIAFLLAEVLLHPNLLSIPYAWLLRRVLPDIYGVPDGAPEGLAQPPRPQLHPYFASGLLLVSFTTLVLFFASGMYAEKIGYANRYVHHANKALRSLNMYLNVRRPPLRARLPLLAPLAFFFPRPEPSPSPTPARSTSRPGTPSRTSSRSASPRPSPTADPADPVTRAPAAAPAPSPPAPTPLAPIPPARSARGELIFSSRVAPAFKDGYERYRAAFERRRAARERAQAERTWAGWAWVRLPWVRARFAALEEAGAGAGAGGKTGGTGTQPSSRASTPGPGPGPAAGAAGAAGGRPGAVRRESSQNVNLGSVRGRVDGRPGGNGSRKGSPAPAGVARSRLSTAGAGTGTRRSGSVVRAAAGSGVSRDGVE